MGLDKETPGHGPRLFFLGAGFSRSAGLPLASELLSLVTDEIHRHFPAATKLDKSLERYKRYVADTTGIDAQPVDIEQFCAFLDHEHILGLRGGDTWSEEGNEDQLMLRWGIGSVLHRATPTVADLPVQYIHFAEQLRPMDCVVTFNYDRILENTLDAVGVPYRRFPYRYTACHDMYSEVDSERGSQEVTIFKVHGSIDWVDRSGFERNLRVLARSNTDTFHRRRNLIFGDSPITVCHPLVEGPRPEGDPLASVMILSDLNAYYRNLNVWHHAAPLILAPSAVKLLYGAPMREIWAGVPQGVVALAGLCIVGYSLPPADPHARQILWSISSAYGSSFGDPDWSLYPKQRIKVIDHRNTTQDADELKDSYRFLDPSITDYLLDGFDNASVSEIFG
jgi:SIR2-like domain